MRRCDFPDCRNYGLLGLVPADTPNVGDPVLLAASPAFETFAACPQHRRAVEDRNMRIKAPRRFAYRHGLPRAGT